MSLDARPCSRCGLVLFLDKFLSREEVVQKPDSTGASPVGVECRVTRDPLRIRSHEKVIP